jgi:hypothetical protein
VTDETPKPCEERCPPEWTGHWRDWHRGHGCAQDPTPRKTLKPTLFTVVAIRRFRTDYVVEAADDRDAWNRVDFYREGQADPLGRGLGVRVAGATREVSCERFVVEVNRD